jgi:asparagine synthetase B (glutamine-hydrolysing)
VALTGYGGDEWFTGSTTHTADLLRRGRLLAAWRQLRAEATLHLRRDVISLARRAVAPLIPQPVRSMISPYRRRRAPLFDWIRPEFQRRVGLMDRLRPEWAYKTDFPTAAQGEIYRVATGATQLIGDDMEERAAAAAGLEQRHPFTDRRIAEFGLALPEEQRWSETETKVVLRRAMRLGGSVPEQVLARHDKAEFSSSYVDALQLFGAGAFARLRTEDLGWVDGEKVRAMYPRMLSLYTSGDEAYIPLSGSLWAVLSLELCLDGLQQARGHGARAIAAPAAGMVETNRGR